MLLLCGVDDTESEMLEKMNENSKTAWKIERRKSEVLWRGVESLVCLSRGDVQEVQELMTSACIWLHWQDRAWEGLKQ